MRAWSAPHVVASLLAAAGGWRDREWIASYFLARRGPTALRGAFAARTERDASLRLRELDQRLHLSADTGGLATYYEIVTQRVYCPSPEFAPGPGATVVDVGANVGVFSLWAASRVGSGGRVIAIEPHPLSHSYLERNLAPFGSARSVQVACGEGSAELELRYVPGRLSVASFLPREDRTGSVRVPVRRLDELTAGAGDIDLLKIDVEGVEPQVLAGAESTLARVRRLVIEVDTDGELPIERQLAQFGFTRVARRTGMWGLADATVAAFARR